MQLEVKSQCYCERPAATDVVISCQLSNAMARVKNTTRESGGKRIPRALFSEAGEGRISKTVCCENCGLNLRRSNLARHRRRCGLSQLSSDGIKLTVRLPSITKALREKALEDTDEEDSLSPELSCLPQTPETDEEVFRGLARLYAARMSEPKPNALTYEETKLVMGCIKNPSKLEGLKEVLEASGWKLRSDEEWTEALHQAEGRAKEEVTRELETAGAYAEEADPADEVPPVLKEVPEADAVGPESAPSTPKLLELAATLQGEQEDRLSSAAAPPPPLCITTRYSEDGPQTIVLHTGGVWGIQVTPCKV